MTLPSRWLLGLATFPMALFFSGPRPLPPLWALRLQPDSSAVAEAAYARAVAALADSVIRQLDVLPARAQLRVQTAFLDPARAGDVPFVELARRSAAAADVAESIAERFGAVAPPEDLVRLHAELTASLQDAQTALARVVAASAACARDAGSLQRCQVPFTEASEALSRAYKRYLTVRRRVGSQVTDTGTILPAFGGAVRAP